MLNHVVAEPIRKHLPRQRGDRDARALALEDVAEILKVAVAAPHRRRLELERGDVRLADDLVRRVHVAADAVGLGVADLGAYVRWRAVGGGGGLLRFRGSFRAARRSLRRTAGVRRGGTASRTSWWVGPVRAGGWGVRWSWGRLWFGRGAVVGAEVLRCGKDLTMHL